MSSVRESTATKVRALGLAPEDYDMVVRLYGDVRARERKRHVALAAHPARKVGMEQRYPRQSQRGTGDLLGPRDAFGNDRDLVRADIVLGGRTTDTAVLAAVPVLRGAGAGAAWHAAKIAECGALCTMQPRAG